MSSANPDDVISALTAAVRQVDQQISESNRFRSKGAKRIAASKRWLDIRNRLANTTLSVEKVSKESVRYEHPAKIPEHDCAKCVHFMAPGSCHLVAGKIEPEDWCSMWDPGVTELAWDDKLPKAQKCGFCAKPATRRQLWAEGMAYQPLCDSEACMEAMKKKVGADNLCGQPRPIRASGGITAEAETALIKERAKTPEAQRKHKFVAAHWTHKNGHPRCAICGDEESTTGYCQDERPPSQYVRAALGAEEPRDDKGRWMKAAEEQFPVGTRIPESASSWVLPNGHVVEMPYEHSDIMSVTGDVSPHESRVWAGEDAIKAFQEAGAIRTGKYNSVTGRSHLYVHARTEPTAAQRRTIHESSRGQASVAVSRQDKGTETVIAKPSKYELERALRGENVIQQQFAAHDEPRDAEGRWTRQFGEYTMRYSKPDMDIPRHRIIAEDSKGAFAGELMWHPKTHTITNVNVAEQHRRKGLASAMLNWGREMRPAPKHSADRTNAGEAWAKAVGGPLPRRKPVNSDEDRRGTTAAAHDVSSEVRDSHGRWSVAATKEVAPDDLVRGKHQYMLDHGMEPEPLDFEHMEADPKLQRRIAQAYEAMPSMDESAKPAWDQFAKEVEDQYHHLTHNLGVRVEVTPDDPYDSVHEMVEDIRKNHRLKVLSTASTGAHPYLSNEQNDHFRAVHDAFGHAAIGRGFDRHGEAAAWASHAQMFTPAARGALATETRGQASTLVFGSHKGEFPEQKIALMPEEFWHPPTKSVETAAVLVDNDYLRKERDDKELEDHLVKEGEEEMGVWPAGYKKMWGADGPGYTFPKGSPEKVCPIRRKFLHPDVEQEMAAVLSRLEELVSRRYSKNPGVEPDDNPERIAWRYNPAHDDDATEEDEVHGRIGGQHQVGAKKIDKGTDDAEDYNIRPTDKKLPSRAKHVYYRRQPWDTSIGQEMGVDGEARDATGRWVKEYEGEEGNSHHITRTERGEIPLRYVVALRGARGERPLEHRNKHGQEWDDFVSDIKSNGIKDPIFITVDPGEAPKISEGNHRRDAAAQLQMKSVPVEIRYFGHAEREGTVQERGIKAWEESTRPTTAAGDERKRDEPKRDTTGKFTKDVGWTDEMESGAAKAFKAFQKAYEYYQRCADVNGHDHPVAVEAASKLHDAIVNLAGAIKGRPQLRDFNEPRVGYPIGHSDFGQDKPKVAKEKAVTAAGECATCGTSIERGNSCARCTAPESLDALLASIEAIVTDLAAHDVSTEARNPAGSPGGGRWTKVGNSANKFPAECKDCGKRIATGEGQLGKVNGAWATKKGDTVITKGHCWPECDTGGLPKGPDGAPPSIDAIPSTETPDAPAAKATAFKPTPEQDEVVAKFKSHKNLVIEAGAGAAKTTTLRLCAESEPARRGLYIAFNRAIVEESRGTFPRSVKCSTAHALAYAAIVAQDPARKKRFTEQERVSNAMAARILGTTNIPPLTFARDRDGNEFSKPVRYGPEQFAGTVLTAISNFCKSTDEKPSRKHIWTDPQLSDADQQKVRDAVSPFLDKAWADITDRTGKGQLRFTEDHYLKLWQLSKPTLDFDYIMFDEAQDANPVMLDVFNRQKEHSQLVAVGDQAQSIYGFTGAVNAIPKLQAQGYETATLSTSFRFGPEVAEVANGLLERLGTKLRITGAGASSRVGPIAEPDVLLTRTNGGAVSEMLSAKKTGRKTHLVGGASDIVGFCLGAKELIEKGSTQHRELRAFHDWAEVQRVVKTPEGADMKILVDLIDKFGYQDILDAVKHQPSEEETKKSGGLILSTAHKSKGRQWDKVALGGDFQTAKEGEPDVSDEELKLLYVACTRAKKALDLTACPQALDPKAKPPEEDALALTRRYGGR